MDDRVINSNIISQLLASLYMLKNCIDLCPITEWNEKHNDYPFSQVVFHTLFDCDYNLCDTELEFKEQYFHKANTTIFDDYEELEASKAIKVYGKIFINEYYDHCRIKTIATIEIETFRNMLESNSDVRKNMTKLERYLNSIRHIQHHAAQLGLRLQFITGKEMDWISRGTE